MLKFDPVGYNDLRGILVSKFFMHKISLRVFRLQPES
jgi:hypothetical protein